MPLSPDSEKPLLASDLVFFHPDRTPNPSVVPIPGTEITRRTDHPSHQCADSRPARRSHHYLFDSLREPLAGPLLRVDAFSTIPGLVIGVIAFLYHVSYLTRPGIEGRMRDGHVALWSAAMMLYLAVQGSIRARRETVRVAMVNHAFQGVCTFVSFLGYAICGFEPAAAFLMFANTVFAAVAVIATIQAPAPEADTGSASAPEKMETGAASDGRQPADAQPKEDPCWVKAFLVYNAFNSVVFDLFFILLTVGAMTFASGATYQTRGKEVVAGGYKMYYNCEGPTNSGRPVVIMECDASHGMHDFWPLQAAFTKAGRRSCIFDKPGVRFSDDFRADQKITDLSNFYDELIASFGEPAPYTMLAWGGGGELVYEYAKRNPAKVSSMVFLNVYYANVEWRMYQSQKNLTEAQTKEYRDLQLIGRSTVFGILRGLAVPWGIAAVFISSNRSGYTLVPERFDEAKWFYKVPKTWTTQYFMFKSFLENGETGDNAPPTAKGNFAKPVPAQLAGKPIIQIANNRSRDVLCKNKNANECAAAVADEAFLLQDARGVAGHTGNGTVIVCSASDCDLNMVYAIPEYIVAQMAAQPSYV